MCAAPLLLLDDLRVGRADGSGGGRDDLAVDGVSLEIGPGGFHAIVGPPGSGLEALAGAIGGAPGHPVTGGRLRFRGDDVTPWSAEVRAKAGLFLAIPDGEPIRGVTVLQLLSQAIGARRGVDTAVAEVRLAMLAWADDLGIDRALLDRAINEPRSPADARRSELLQLAVLEPDLAVINEPGSELGEDVVTALVDGIATVRAKRPTLGTLTITHCRRLIEQLRPDHLQVMVGGRIVATGGPALADRLDTEGYESFT